MSNLDEQDSKVANNEPSTEKLLGGCTGKGFMPGQSGNPSGRPKKRPISEIYERIMENPENVGLIEAAVLKTILAGKMAAQLTLKEMAERIEGKVTQPVDVNGELTLTLSDRIERARQKLNGDSSS